MSTTPKAAPSGERYPGPDPLTDLLSRSPETALPTNPFDCSATREACREIEVGLRVAAPSLTNRRLRFVKLANAHVAQISQAAITPILGAVAKATLFSLRPPASWLAATFFSPRAPVPKQKDPTPIL